MPRVRFTLRRMMVAVAIFGAVFASIAWANANLGTMYAAGFTEANFARLRVGMTPDEVEKIMGTPLEKIPWPTQGNVENWVYSDSPIGWNYEQRWVIFENKLVKSIVKHYWVE